MNDGEDHYRQADGIRDPDPTLGRVVWRREPPTAQQESATEGTGRAITELADQLDEDAAPTGLKPQRKRVVLADPRQASRALRARVELEEQTSWGEVLIKDLAKRQLRTGLVLAALVVAVLCAMPLAFFLSPTFAGLTVLGMPLAWLLLGVLPFPVLFGVGLVYNRLAERNERDFVDMIES